MRTVKEICNIIFEIEEKYNLLFSEIQGIYPWQLVRMYVYYEITRKADTFGSAQQGNLTLINKIKSFLPFIKNSILHNPLKGNYHKDIIIFDHPRKTLFQGKYQDIYSYFLPEVFDEYNKSFELVESPYFNEHLSEKEEYLKYNDRILLGSYLYKKRTKVKFRDNELDLLNSVKEEIENTFKIKLDLVKIIENHILNFKYEYEKYKKLFEKRKVEQVYLVVAYENQAVVAACSDLNIEVIELQHGTISNYHLGYSYPKLNSSKSNKEKNIKYFPNKILSFGDYWQNASSYPISSSDIISIGFPYFEISSKDFPINKNKKQILFISQGVIGKYLSKFAYDLHKKIDSSYEIIYKLHPGEYSNWRDNYPQLVESNKSKNFKVVDNSKTSLYKFLSESQYQIGAFSTAIYEGLQFDCKTFIVDLPGVEYLEDLIQKNILKKVSSPDEVINLLDDFNSSNYNKDYFFKPFRKSIFKKILK